MNSFLDKITAKWNEGKFVCVGLDQANFESNKSVIDATSDLICAYKPNAAFYKEAELQKTVSYIKSAHPDIPIILDAKRGDIESTNEAIVSEIFDNLGVDGVTVHPYLGKEALLPFLERTDKGIIVLVKTSNPGAGEFQDLEVYPERSRRGKPLYQVVAEHVTNWNTSGNLAVVVGATYPEELAQVREIVGDMPILIPGVGVQGGDLEATVKAGRNSKGQGMIINSSRSIIFAPNPREATLKLHQDIVTLLKS